MKTTISAIAAAAALASSGAWAKELTSSAAGWDQEQTQ
jgi:hypothetical protein